MPEKRNTITRSEFERILSRGLEIEDYEETQQVPMQDKFGHLVRFSPKAVKENADRIFGR